MAKKEIVWTENAKLQFEAILKYYIERNGNKNYSLKLIDEVEDLLNILSHSELIGRLTSNKHTRVIPMKVYLIFYEISESRIEILSIWDNRQDEGRRKIK